MRIKIFALLLVAAISVFSLVACGEDGENPGGNGGNGGNGGSQECQHSFSEDWSSDKTSHWHRATCEHGEIKDSLADHADVDEDGMCDVCEYEVGHTHAYSTDWTYDENNHWHDATCTHSDLKDSMALHADDDQNGECDECTAHVHIKGESGFCKGCGKPMEEINKSDFETVINAVTNQGGLVNGVQIQYNQNIFSNYPDYYDGEHKVWQSYNRSTKQNISVLFGKNGYVNSFTKSDITTGLGSHQTVTTSTFESWHEKDGSTVFGVVSENGADPVLAAEDANRLLGNLYTLSTVASGYGTENFLYELYLASQSSSARDFDIVYLPDENKINFSFNILSVNKINGTDVSVTPGDGETGDQVQTGENTSTYNVNYFEVTVSFSFNDEFVLTSLDAGCSVYTNEAGQLSDKSKNLKDVNLRYYPETGKFEFVKYDESYNPDGDDHYRVVDKSQVKPSSYSYSVTQTVGERTAENEHPKSSFIPTRFEIFSDIERTSKIEGSANVGYRQFFYIYIGNCQPEGTSLDFVFDLVDYQILDSNGNLIKGTDIMEGDSDKFKASFTYGPEEGRYFMLFPLKTGNYTFVITYQGKIAHQISIVVK